MAVRLSALTISGALFPSSIIRLLLRLISVRGLTNPKAIVRFSELRKLKKLDYLIETRSRNLPACRIVPQSFTIPRSLLYFITLFILTFCHLFLTYNSRILWLGTRGPRRLTTLQASTSSTAYCKNSFIFI
jgi:hypothetical protein